MTDRGSASGFEAAWSTLALDRTAAIALGATITPDVYATLAGRSTVAASVGVTVAPTLPALGITGITANEPAPEGVPQVDLEVVGVLGEGGMGRVLLARQRSLGRHVAIKVARIQGDVESPAAVAALLHEASVTGALEHAGIAPIHALGRDARGRPAIVMKRLEGVQWSELVHQADHPAWPKLLEGRDDRSEVHIEVFMAVCNAVHFAHARGIVHRDIKLENVMVGEYGEVHLVDWGIAVRTEGEAGALAHALVGTPAYMAPEMLEADATRVTARTDVYLLGATLHEVLTRRPRHDGTTLYAVMAQAFESVPYEYASTVPTELATICNRATHVEPSARFPSALALRQAVADYVRHRGSVALASAASERLAEFRAQLASTTTERDAPARIGRLGTECRFGFVQALRDWPDNAAAREGLGECLELMAENELAQDNPVSARSLLTELPSPRPDLEARVSSAEAAHRLRHERAAEAERMEREFDLSTAAGPRAAFVTGLAVLLALVGVLMSRLNLPQPEDRADPSVFVPPMVLWAVLIPALVWSRKQIFATAINRRVVGTVIIGFGTQIVHRGLAILAGSIISNVFWTDLLMFAVLAAIAGLAVLRWAWVGVPLFLAGAVAITLAPHAARGIYGVTMTTVLLLSAAFLWRTRKGRSALP